jgi:hypothetical protein
MGHSFSHLIQHPLLLYSLYWPPPTSLLCYAAVYIRDGKPYRQWYLRNSMMCNAHLIQLADLASLCIACVSWNLISGYFSCIEG